MALNQRLDLRQGQSLVMTPQLQQAIKLLQMSNMELQAFVDQELERNPLLERVKFLAIFAGNLDEFFQVRVAGIQEQREAGVVTATPEGMTPARVSLEHTHIYRVMTADGERLAIAVNVSARQFRHPQFADTVAEAIDGYQIGRAHV